MIFSYNWLKDYVQKLPKPQKLAELLAMHSFELEEVRRLGKNYILDIDVLSNRGHDCLCHWGMAREIAAITDKDLKSLKRKKLKKEKGKIQPIDLRIKCPQLVPRYSAIVVEGVKVAPSPKWLKERVESVGLRSINNIVDLTNYVMLEVGQPLHAFDYDKIQGQVMILRESKKGEKLVTLDNTKHILDNGILIIENKNKLIDLVGIMGGKLSETDLKTKNIILQAGNFDRQTIYKAAKKLNHRTEASNIYSQGIDHNLTISTLERAYFLLTKLGGGKIVQIIDIYPKKVLPKRVELDLDYLKSLLGMEIPKKEILKILKSLEFKILKDTKNKLLVEIPTFRLDISLPEDLIEEIGRIYGYQKIPAVFPVVSLIPSKKNFQIFWENIIKNILKELGLTEVYNYSFIGEKEADIFNCNKKELIELENPMSQEFKYLRPSLIPNLVKNAKNNFRYFDRIRIFELGKVFLSENLEKRMLSGLIADKKSSGEEFYRLKGIIDSLFNKLGISDIWYDEVGISPDSAKFLVWNLKKCAEIKIGNDKIGFLGEVSEKILEKLKIKEKIFLFDIDFEKIIKLCSEEHEYQPISQHPTAVRDLAVLVPRGVKVVDVLNKINTAGGPLVRDVDLFDIYEGEELPRGKKNLAFHIIYQAEDRTLKSEEIDKIQQKIIKVLEENPGWEVRK